MPNKVPTTIQQSGESLAQGPDKRSTTRLPAPGLKDLPDEVWKQELQRHQAEPLAFAVTRKGATEPPFSGRYDQHFEPGEYRCVCCQALLFDSRSKFDAGCGWPSFSVPVTAAVEERLDRSHGMTRTETRCVHCGAHLGHVFNDGPVTKEHASGLRYCINSAALSFNPQEEK